MFGDNDTKLDYADVLLVPRESDLSSRSQIDMTVDHFEIPVVPIIAANMDGVGTFEMAKALGRHKVLTALIKHYPLEDLLDFYSNEDDSRYAIYSMGTTEDDWKKFVAFDIACADAGTNHPIAVCIDVANGYTAHLERFVSEVRENFPDYVLMVGNVVTPERTEKLIDCGADIIKIGIGPGSVCTTRKATGVGYPQFSAVMECAAAADAVGGTICADGGITCSGDIAKAFAAGAKYVMCGGLFAGHAEGLGDRLRPLPGDMLPFYGMASKEAQEKHNGGIAEYRASEGKFVTVPFRGRIDPTIQEILGGIRSACTYIGADGVDSMHRRAKFVKVYRQLNNIFGS